MKKPSPKYRTLTVNRVVDDTHIHHEGQDDLPKEEDSSDILPSDYARGLYQFTKTVCLMDAEGTWKHGRVGIA